MSNFKEQTVEAASRNADLDRVFANHIKEGWSDNLTQQKGRRDQLTALADSILALKPTTKRETSARALKIIEGRSRGKRSGIDILVELAGKESGDPEYDQKLREIVDTLLSGVRSLSTHTPAREAHRPKDYLQRGRVWLAAEFFAESGGEFGSAFGVFVDDLFHALRLDPPAKEIRADTIRMRQRGENPINFV